MIQVPKLSFGGLNCLSAARPANKLAVMTANYETRLPHTEQTGYT
jgi:hypothetical protein